MFALLTRPAAAAPLPYPPMARLCVRSADELRRALRETRDRSVALDTSALNCVLRADERRSRLEIQGAVTWSGLADWLGAKAAPLAHWARCHRMSAATVAETLSCDLPAPDGLPLARYVESLALVTLDGELRRVDRERGTDLFRLVVGGQGVFGMLYSITLRIDALLAAAVQAQPPIVIAASNLACPRRTGFELDALLPPEQAAGFLADARSLLAERRLTPLRVTLRALRACAETALSWATRDWSEVSLSVPPGSTLGASVHATEVCRLLLGAAMARGGSFPARMACSASAAQLRLAHPQLPAFLGEKRRYDPNERLQNDWYRGVSALLRRAA